VDPSTWPRSVGPFGTDTTDASAAISYVTREALHICRRGRYSKNAEWIQIPWHRVESVEILAPDPGAVESAGTRGERKLLAAVLGAKVKLARERNPMTLLVPWNEEFTALAPSNLEIVKKWQWPYSIV
jgi:hypothetical protein